MQGETKQAVTETIRICKDRNILKEYLESREKEVVTIMMSLFDEEQMMKSFVRSEKYDLAKEKAALMLRKGKITAEEIREYFPELLESDIQELEAEFVPLV